MQGRGIEEQFGAWALVTPMIRAGRTEEQRTGMM